MKLIASSHCADVDVLMCCHCSVLRQSELVNGSDMLLLNSTDNQSEWTVSRDTGLELHQVLCAPPVTNQTWQMASGYIGAALMLVMSVYGRYDNSFLQCAQKKNTPFCFVYITPSRLN